MHPIITRSFGGLTRSYYIRNFLFGLIFPAILLFVFSHGKVHLAISVEAFVTVFVAANCFLYPYSRFVYESVVDYIVGRNIFFVNAIFMLFVKLMTMLFCWYFAVVIAPIGLVYLYFRSGSLNAA